MYIYEFDKKKDADIISRTNPTHCFYSGKTAAVYGFEERICLRKGEEVFIYECEECGSFDLRNWRSCFCGSAHVYCHGTVEYERWRYVHL